MTTIPDATYKALRDARRAGCCAPLRRPCPACLAYLDGVEDGYRAGGVDAANHPAAQTLRYLAPFIKALDRPAQDVPGLEKLMNTPTVLDEVRPTDRQAS